ncbi:MAG: ATP-binding cassette domain-containing protein [Bdellovibrio sp.]
MKINAQLSCDYKKIQLHFEFALTGPYPLGIFGPSGSGKSSLIKSLAGLNKDLQGTLEVDGQIWQKSSEHIYLPSHQRAVGYVSQTPVVFPHMTVLENIVYGFNRTQFNQRRFLVDDVIELLKLKELLPQSVDSLSGGEKQRVCLGRAILSSPTLLILDEPLSALDGFAQKEIVALLKKINSDFALPMIYVSHSVREILELTNTVMLVESGKIKQIDTTAELTPYLQLLQSW